MSKILVVEDDKEINRLICDYLSKENYDLLSATDGMKAMSVLREREDISLVLLDIMLPFQSGDVVLKKLREFSDVPVIVISAKDTVQTKIDVIRMGADDYITKPFDLDEVLVRVEAILRRSGKNTKAISDDGGTVLEFKKMKIDTLAKTITVNEHMIDVTNKEYSILELMLQNPAKLFSKANLFESVWNEPYFSEDNTLKVHISNIRNKIKPHDPDEYIETIWGMGYRLK